MNILLLKQFAPWVLAVGILGYFITLHVQLHSRELKIASLEMSVVGLEASNDALSKSIERQNKQIEENQAKMEEINKQKAILESDLQALSESAKCDVEKVLKAKVEKGQEIQRLRDAARRLQH